MPEEWAPPVVAVVVSSDPGDWFERCLESVRGQDYPNLALLVVDDGSAVDLTPRVAAVEPAAIVRRRTSRGGYSAGANEALQGVDGAAFFLFCHDDAVLDPGAVRLLVEESFRANAAVVGPKLVSADHPELIRQVGLGVHRHGTAAPRVEPGELDQSQHDEAREVFAVPGACTLVRADLFEALQGYDPAMTTFGEDVDFCWRAQIAGARVAVAPQARVRHGEIAASGGRELHDPKLLSRRHELRAALKNYSVFQAAVVLVEMLVLGVAESLLAFASGERERARRVVRAWRWNIAERGSLRTARRHLREIRQVPDRVIAARMVRQGRVRRYLRPATSPIPLVELEALATDRSPARGALGSRAGERERVGTWWSRVRRGEVPAGQLTLAGCLLAVAVLGVRGVVFSRVPLFADFVRMPTGSTMLGQFFGGVDNGTGVHAAPTAYGLVGLVGLVAGNSTATAWKLIDVASLVAGAIGVSRLLKPFGSSRGRLVAAVAFVGLPLAWNSLATGNVKAAVTLGALPYALARMARATGLAPFAREVPSARGRARALAAEVVPFGLLLAVLGALAPAGLLAVGAAAVPVVLGCLMNWRPAAAARALAVLAGAVIVAAGCCLPWSVEWLQHGASWSAFSGAVPGAATGPASLLRGHVGPIGAWWGAWGLVIAAGYAIVAGRGERRFWASAWWMSAAAATALAWAGSAGWLGAGGGATMVLAAPASVLVAASCGLGVAVFEKDVVARESLGWRQAAAGIASTCLIVGLAPALGAAAGGRAGMPTTGVDQTLDWTAPSAQHGYRVLWLGDPRALPGAGWQLAPGVSWYATSEGLPSVAQEWPQPSPGRLGAVATAIRSAERGQTADVGLLLAPLGVRYVVLPVADAPDLPGTQVPPVVAGPPLSLVGALRAQSDLVERPVEAGAQVFANADWRPSDGEGLPSALAPGGGRASPGGAESPAWRDTGIALGLVAWFLALFEGVLRRRRWGDQLAVPQPVAVAGLAGS